VKALAFGDRSDLTTEDWRILQRTGTSHLMAISGLHVGLAALFGYGFGSLLARLLLPLLLYIPAQLVGAIFGLLFASTYAGLAGFSTPTLRALTMLALLFCYRLLRRHGSARQLLQMTLLLVLLMDPLAVLSAGFWLSFAAVALIIVLLERHHDSEQLMTRPLLSRLQRYGSDLLSLQWVLSLGLIPLSLLFFGAVSVLSPLANLLAVPLVSLLVVPAALAGNLSVLLGFNGFAAACFKLAEQILLPLWQFLQWLAAQPWALWQLPVLQGWQLALISIGLLWLLLPLNPRRWLGLPWLLLPLLWQPARPAVGELWLTVLDVGQGLAVVVRTRSHTLLYDAGPRYFSLDAGRSVVVPYLRRQGINTLDLLVASHADTDHVGGMQAVRAAIPVARFIGSVPMRFPQASECLAGQKFVFDTVSFEVLGPPVDDFGNDNDSSCILHISGKYGSILLSGDASTRRERWLVRRYREKLRSTVIVAPHHGSRSSSSEALIRMVNPVVNVFSAGFHSRYHHPHPQIVRRYREYGVRSYNTASSGAVAIKLSEQGLSVEEYRKQHQHYWGGMGVSSLLCELRKCKAKN
ncbi:MAG TPA: DNA internalization-related competence protein ComEC/Rec2, partial [Gammaproteobacteria bacterium]|nr:DNA internalization-related competence protein ComEC/Rec2 [Gammaproteobacteria bacterium]